MNVPAMKLPTGSAGRLPAVHPADPLALDGRSLALHSAPFALGSASKRGMGALHGVIRHFCHRPVPPPMGDRANNCLTALIDGDALDIDPLFALAAVAFQCLHLDGNVLAKRFRALSCMSITSIDGAPARFSAAFMVRSRGSRRPDRLLPSSIHHALHLLQGGIDLGFRCRGESGFDGLA